MRNSNSALRGDFRGGSENPRLSRGKAEFAGLQKFAMGSRARGETNEEEETGL